MEQKEKYLALLNEQLEKINSKSFDLIAWKKSTALLVANLFGQEDTRTRSIDSIEYEYNSWSLRDESGTTDPVKVLCKETLQTIIQELKLTDILELPDKYTDQTDLQFIWEAFEDELTGARLKKLRKELTETSNAELKLAEIDILLQELPEETKRNIIRKILSSESLKKWLLS